MKSHLKISIFMLAIAGIIIFSNAIQHHIVDSYNHCVDQLAQRTVAQTNPLGF